MARPVTSNVTVKRKVGNALIIFDKVNEAYDKVVRKEAVMQAIEKEWAKRRNTIRAIEEKGGKFEAKYFHRKFGSEIQLRYYKINLPGKVFKNFNDYLKILEEYSKYLNPKLFPKTKGVTYFDYSILEATREYMSNRKKELSAQAVLVKRKIDEGDAAKLAAETSDERAVINRNNRLELEAALEKYIGLMTNWIMAILQNIHNAKNDLRLKRAVIDDWWKKNRRRLYVVS
jgi:hypothetical protein